jgi:hypothetical protein
MPALYRLNALDIGCHIDNKNEEEEATLRLAYDQDNIWIGVF